MEAQQRLLVEFRKLRGFDADILGENLVELPDTTRIEIAVDVTAFEVW